jgi:hypothetical protein
MVEGFLSTYLFSFYPKSKRKTRDKNNGGRSSSSPATVRLNPQNKARKIMEKMMRKEWESIFFQSNWSENAQSIWRRHSARVQLGRRAANRLDKKTDEKN